MPGTVLTVASGKGGVGKTTTAVNLAVALWTDGNAVAVVDADLGMANLSAVLGLEPAATLHDVLAGRADLDEALIEAKDGDLIVLPGERELSGFADADPGVLQAVLEELAGRCDYVVVDTGAGLSYEDVLPLGLADEVLLVTTPDPAAVGDTRKTLELSGLLDGPVRGVVVTRALEDTDAETVAAEIGVPLLGVIPEDPAVTRSTTRGDPLASHAPDAPATAAYGRLAAAIAGRAAVDEPPTAADAEPAAPAAPDEAAESTADAPGDEPDDPATAAASEDASDAGPETTDADDATPADEDEPAGTDEAAADEPDDDDDAAGASEEAAGDSDQGEESADAEPERRGGITGWLGRLFS